MRSIWQATAGTPCFPRLDGDVRTDVLIIGGGIAGILTAYFLGRSGVGCVLAEKGLVCSGTTGKTTAKITFQHGLNYHKILKNRGAETARAYLDANRAAFDRYAGMCRTIDCDWEERDNFVYSVSDRKALEDELGALTRIGYDADFREDPDIPVKTVGAVRFPRQAQFHPLKFLAAVSSGLNIYENTFVREMVGNTAVTDRGKIVADTVIAATHFPFINKHGGYFLKLFQHRSYVVALGGAPLPDGMYVDEDKAGLSFRDYGGFLLLGGGGHRTGREGGCWDELRRFAKRNYPGAKERFYWAAQDCVSLDDVPYIGRYSNGTRNFFVASGFNKWGMTGAMTAAGILCDLALGKKNEYAAVFDPSRSVLGKRLFANGFEAAKDLLTPSVKRCPHLGCALTWNRAERSWDCPCHGSRFAEDGTVLDNPANGYAGKI